jgi:hypothetical protein
LIFEGVGVNHKLMHSRTAVTNRCGGVGWADSIGWRRRRGGGGCGADGRSGGGTIGGCPRSRWGRAW